MLKKTITYTNPFTDEQVSEDHYFHISKADIVEMEVEEHAATYVKNGETLTGMQALVQKIIDAEDGKAVLAVFKQILRRAYGKKVGERFIKTPEIWAEFEASSAYSEFIFELLTDADAMANFVNGIVPKDLQEEAARLAAKAEKSGGTPTTTPAPVTAPAQVSTPDEEVQATRDVTDEDPTGLTTKTTPQILTAEQVVAMDADDLKVGIAEGRYKLA